MQLSKASGAKKKTSLPQAHSLRLIEFWKLPQPMPTCRPAKHWNAVYKILVLNAAGAHHLHVQGYGQVCAPECAMEFILIFISSS
jgi:hypothetical protein